MISSREGEGVVIREVKVKWGMLLSHSRTDPVVSLVMGMVVGLLV